MTYDIKALQVHFTGVLPYLSKNLGLANAEYMNSQISHGAFNTVLGRHAQATLLSKIDELPREELASDEDLFKAGAVIMLDLKAVLKDLKDDELTDARKKYDDLLQFYAENGFTEKHILFGFPSQPKKVPAA